MDRGNLPVSNQVWNKMQSLMNDIEQVRDSSDHIWQSWSCIMAISELEKSMSYFKVMVTESKDG